MDNPLGTGFMAVFAVSGSVVLLAMQFHKRLLSDFMKKMEFEINNSTTGASMKDDEPKKKVRFADEVMGGHDKCGCVKKITAARPSPANNYDDANMKGMPENWQVMYKGIMQSRNLRGYNEL